MPEEPETPVITLSSTATLADALVEALNDAVDEDTIFSTQFTAVRQNYPRFDLLDLEEINVVVVPKGRTTAHISRGDLTKEQRLEIGIQKHFSNVNADEVDGLGALVEEIEEFILTTRLSNYTCLEVSSVLADSSIAAEEHLQKNTWTSVLVATYTD